MLTSTRRESLLVVQARVIKALMLRDLRTRFFGHGLGYIVALLWPMVHIGVLMGIWTLLGRVAPFGDSLLQFVAVGLVPCITYMYMSRFIMFSVTNNRPLLNFPIVKLVDVILARALLEAMAACCVAALIAMILYGINVAIIPADVLVTCEAFLATLLFGLGVGSMNGIIVLKVKAWMLVSILVNILLYVTSGILIIPEYMPETIRWYLSFNPLMHAVEWMREGFYLGYRSLILSKPYLIGVGATLFFSALATERMFRKALQR